MGWLQAPSLMVPVTLHLQELSGISSVFSFNLWAVIASRCLASLHVLPHRQQLRSIPIVRSARATKGCTGDRAQCGTF